LHYSARILTRPDITRLRPRSNGLRVRPNLRDRDFTFEAKAEARRCMDYIAYVNGTYNL